MQTGTKSYGNAQYWSFNSPFDNKRTSCEIQIPKVVELCNSYNILMKEHNTDYLSDEAQMAS